MRHTLPFLLLAALACSGGPGAPVPQAAPPNALEAPTAPSTPAPSPDLGASLGDHWLVILASKKDAAEPVPALDTLAAHPEVTTHAGTLLSSRFKNLMPCYTVTYAEATTDKKAALALSKTLNDLGVDNYVKNTGKWVGRSEAIDSYCASPADTGGGDVQVATFAGGSLWLPVSAPESVLRAALAGAPPPSPIGDGFDAWIQPASNPPSAVGGVRYRAVDVRTGQALGCTSGRVAALTLGIPHFGYLQAEGPHTAPACGEPALYAELQCDGRVVAGSWVVVPESTPLTPYAPVGDAPNLVRQATSALSAATDFESDPDLLGYDASEITRTVTVTRWRSGASEVALVAGTRAIGPGVCGGDSASWTGIYALAGDTLGAPLGGLKETGPNTPVGVVDVGADGRPEFVLEEFPNTTSIFEGTAARGSLELAYCDCPC